MRQTDLALALEALNLFFTESPSPELSQRQFSYCRPISNSQFTLIAGTSNEAKPLPHCEEIPTISPWTQMLDKDQAHFPLNAMYGPLLTCILTPVWL